MRIALAFREELVRVALLVTVAMTFAVPLAKAGEEPIDKEAQAKRRPNVYLTVFNNGYAGDPLPEEAEKFEKLLKTITSEGNFNAVMCRYSDRARGAVQEVRRADGCRFAGRRLSRLPEPEGVRATVQPTPRQSYDCGVPPVVRRFRQAGAGSGAGHRQRTPLGSHPRHLHRHLPHRGHELPGQVRFRGLLRFLLAPRPAPQLPPPADGLGRGQDPRQPHRPLRRGRPRPAGRGQLPPFAATCRIPRLPAG